MNTLRLFLPIFIISILFLPVFSQNPEWIYYKNGSDVRTIAIESENIWAGTNGGLVKIDRITGDKIFYNKNNSNLPDDDITSIAIDKSNNKENP